MNPLIAVAAVLGLVYLGTRKRKKATSTDGSASLEQSGAPLTVRPGMTPYVPGFQTATTVKPPSYAWDIQAHGNGIQNYDVTVHRNGAMFSQAPHLLPEQVVEFVAASWPAYAGPISFNKVAGMNSAPIIYELLQLSPKPDIQVFE